MATSIFTSLQSSGFIAQRQCTLRYRSSVVKHLWPAPLRCPQTLLSFWSPPPLLCWCLYLVVCLFTFLFSTQKLLPSSWALAELSYITSLLLLPVVLSFTSLSQSVHLQLIFSFTYPDLLLLPTFISVLHCVLQCKNIESLWTPYYMQQI